MLLAVRWILSAEVLPTTAGLHANKDVPRMPPILSQHSRHPFVGTGLGAFGVIYTRYDSRNGLYRLEQAHNDYLQVLSDSGVIGGLLGLFFIGALFRMGFARRQSRDPFRRGVATGALAGCLLCWCIASLISLCNTTANCAAVSGAGGTGYH